MEKDDNSSIPTKKRILNAAEEVFSEKGYDGASVSEIAKRAGISKTQIFYYFENKKDLLNDIIKECMSDMLPYKNALWDKVDINSNDDLIKFVDAISKILETKRDVIRIGLIESFKNMQTDVSIFEILEPIFKDSLSKSKNLDLDTIDEDKKIEYIMNMTFHSLIPLYSYYILAEKFNDYYNVDSEKSKRMFFKTYYDTFIRNLLGQ